MKTVRTRSSKPPCGIIPLVCPLARADQVAGCGGKAHNLARMLRLGFPVPAGIVVTDRAFQEFLDANHLRGTLADLLRRADFRNPESLRSVSAAIRKQIVNAAIPEKIWETIKEQLAVLRGGGTRIVRSSALGEDGEAASFAGQLDSFPGVASEQALRDALLACWASYWSERVLCYQQTRGVRLRGMGVVVQEQVDADVSGVLFTHSPESRDAEAHLLLEYCRGLGDALVSGQVNPSRVRISRRDLRCRRLTDDSSEEPPPCIPPFTELARAGLALERAFGGPQDIEWAIARDGKLYLVQCRPVTVPVPGDTGREKVVWSNANVNENFPEPICPLLYSIAAEGYYHYFRNLGRAFGVAAVRVQAMEQPLRRLIGVHGARMYYNLSNIHAVLRQVPFGRRLAEFFNQFVGASQTPARRGPEIRRGFLAEVLEVGRIACKAVWQFLFLPRRVRTFERTVEAFAAATQPDELAGRSLAELLDAFRAFLDIRFHRWTNAALADAAAMISYGLLKQVLGRAFPDADLSALHNTLLKGLRDVVSVQPVVRLWELSRHLRRDPALAELFAVGQPEEILKQIELNPAFAAFHDEFQAFLAQWGFRCSGELMLTVPSFQEVPALLLDVLRAYAAREGEGPADVLRRQEAERIAETAHVLRTLRKRKLLALLPWPTRALVVRVLLSWTQRAIALRERARLKQALLYSRCRRIALAIGDRLTAQGRLGRADDIFFLTYPEIDALLAGAAMFPQQVQELVRLRRDGHAELSAMQPPDAFELAEGDYLPMLPTPLPQPDSDGTSGESAALTGVGACGGQAAGRAAVLRDVSECGLLQGGDVLVTRQTDPGWGPVFFLIKGLVMERGGMLSHGAILAREYGIPTVVGVPDATRRIASGQQVTVNGDRGVVHVGL